MSVRHSSRRVEGWNSLPRHVIASPFLTVSKHRQQALDQITLCATIDIVYMYTAKAKNLFGPNERFCYHASFKTLDQNAYRRLCTTFCSMMMMMMKIDDDDDEN